MIMLSGTTLSYSVPWLQTVSFVIFFANLLPAACLLSVLLYELKLIRAEATFYFLIPS